MGWASMGHTGPTTSETRVHDEKPTAPRNEIRSAVCANQELTPSHESKSAEVLRDPWTSVSLCGLIYALTRVGQATLLGVKDTTVLGGVSKHVTFCNPEEGRKKKHGKVIRKTEQLPSRH